MPARSAWNQAMWEVLADGRWHPADQVINAGRKVVPPTTAMASYRRNISRLHKTTTNCRIKATDVAQRRRDGAWDLCRRIIGDWSRRGIAEVRGQGESKEVRLTRKP